MNCPKCGMNALPDETISAVGFAYCKSCGMLWSAWAHAEMDRLTQELATAREKVRKLREGLKKLEWCGMSLGFDGSITAICCIACKGDMQHEYDCWLAALLKEGK